MIMSEIDQVKEILAMREGGHTPLEIVQRLDLLLAGPSMSIAVTCSLCTETFMENNKTWDGICPACGHNNHVSEELKDRIIAFAQQKYAQGSDDDLELRDEVWQAGDEGYWVEAQVYVRAHEVEE
jgi:hypothetical protein